MKRDILVVDDETDILDLTAGILIDDGFETRTAATGAAALMEVGRRVPGLIVLDIWLQDNSLDGLDVLEKIKRDHPDLPVVMMSGHGTIGTAVAAIKKGAYDFIEKPFKADRLLLIAKRAMEAADLKRQNAELRVRAGLADDLLGCSGAIKQVRQTIDKVARTGSRILITGGAGSGKEVVARLIHRQSNRSGGPFVVLNAATMRPDRIEAELFGSEENVETGGVRKVGVFEQAHGGTLFVDEVADMPLETQAKILRVLVDQQFKRVGGMQNVEVDVRVISASNRDLRTAINEGRFREDLYHRLNVVPIAVPALNDRRQDIPMLVEEFTSQISQALGLQQREIGEDALAVLQSADWPGNVRQLKNVIERLLILSPGEPNSCISSEMLPADLTTPTPGAVGRNGEDEVMAMPLREARETFEREYLLAQINRFGGNISRTASFIGMERSALHRKLKSLGISSGMRNQAAAAAAAAVAGE